MVPRHLSDASINEEDVSKKIPLLIEKPASRGRNHVCSLGLVLRVMNSSLGSQTRPHSQTSPRSPLR